MSMDLATKLHGFKMKGLALVRATPGLSDTAKLKLLQTIYCHGSGTATVMRRHKVADLRHRVERMHMARKQAAIAGRADDESFIQKLYRFLL